MPTAILFDVWKIDMTEFILMAMHNHKEICNDGTAAALVPDDF